MKPLRGVLVIVFIAFLFGQGNRLFAQEELISPIVVNSGIDIDRLVKDIFVKGGCVNVGEVGQIGIQESIGHFISADSSLGFREGIILSTGRAIDAIGPNESYQTSTNVAGATGDIDLVTLSGLNVTDVAGIEFDFVPIDSTVSFRYFFASEEYCEFVMV